MGSEGIPLPYGVDKMVVSEDVYPDDGKRPAARNVGVGLLLLGKKTPGGCRGGKGQGGVVHG